MKQCSKCHELKPETEFYKDTRTKDGLKCQCKKCHCETTMRTRDINKHRQSNKEFMRREHQNNPDKVRSYWRTRQETDPRKIRARSLLNSAIRRGKVKRPSYCEKCGASGMVYGHHKDYNKPLDVEWLCADCHGKQHRGPRNMDLGY